MEQLQNLIDPVSSFLWGWLLIYVLLATGLYFSIRTRLVQFRRFGHLWCLVFSSRGGAQGGISSFQAFCIGLASRVGTGNIAGVRSAFGLQPAVAGVSGGIAAAMLNGVKRGLFSNEAGMGSAPNTAATATVAHPAIQGFIQALGVFIDTIVVCSTTAFIILVSGLYDPSKPAAIAGASLTQAAIAQSFGVAGQWFMTVVVFAFAFSSVLGNYAYADANLSFLGCGRATFLVFRIIALFAVLTGSITSLPIVWAFADIAMGVMTLLNVTAILLLSPWAIAVLADYERSLAAGRQPVFVASTTPGLPAVSRDIVW